MNDSFHLYITATQIHVRRKTGVAWRSRIEPAGESQWHAADLATLTMASFKFPPKSRLYIYVGSSLCQFMAIALPVELKNKQERRLAALAMMGRALGLDAAEWSITLDDVPQHKSIVCAIRLALINRLQELAQAHACHLISVRPLVAGLWNTFQGKNQIARDSGLMVFEQNAVTALVRRSAEMESIHALSCPIDVRLVEREIQRVDMLYGSGTSASFHLAMENELADMIPQSFQPIDREDNGLNRKYCADFRDRFTLFSVRTS